MCQATALQRTTLNVLPVNLLTPGSLAVTTAIDCVKYWSTVVFVVLPTPLLSVFAPYFNLILFILFVVLWDRHE